MEIKLEQANCTKLTLQSPVALLAAEKDTGNNFEIEAYSGAVVERWWGKLAIELKGIKAKKQIPVLMGHDPSQIVGYSKDTRLDGSFFVTGVFSGVTDAARQAKGLAEEGFPWQASIGVRAKKILSLEESSECVVNGKTLKGPAEVWLESEVFEVSFVPLGADSNTSIVTFSKFTEKDQPETGRQPIIKEKLMGKITLELLEKEAPEILAEIKESAINEGKTLGLTLGKEEGLKEGAKAERERIQQVLEQVIPGHESLVQKLAFDGKTSPAEAAIQVLSAEKQIRVTAQENLKADAILPVASVTPPEATLKPVAITAENFSQHKDLIEEFGTYDIYEAYTSAMEKGMVKITGGKK